LQLLDMTERLIDSGDRAIRLQSYFEAQLHSPDKPEYAHRHFS
jgi:hypothetical protein